MIYRILRWLGTLDRSYFFAFTSFIASIIASVALAFAPIAQRFDGTDVSLIERDGSIVIILLVLPVLVLGSPLIALPQKPGPRSRNDKINAVASTLVLLGFVVISLASMGLFYVPALILSVASSVSLYFGRDRRVKVPAGSQQDVGEDGVRLSRSARRRMREQERLASEGQGSTEKKGETPLASSRRRRGRNRRKR